MCILLFFKEEEKNPLCAHNNEGGFSEYPPFSFFEREKREHIHTPAVFVALINKPTLSLLLRLQVLSPSFELYFSPPSLKKSLFSSL